jgi:hypothetical protein
MKAGQLQFEVALDGDLLMIARVPSNISERSVSADHAHVCAPLAPCDVQTWA